MKPTNPQRGGGGHEPNRSNASGDPRAPWRENELHNDDVAHEQSDINVRAVVMSAVLVAVVCTFTAGLMYGLFALLERGAAARDPKLSPLSRPATNMPPTTLASPRFGSAPEPQLLTDEPTNLAEIRALAQGQLTGYAWVDQRAGVARIPLDEAKKLVLERGLPVRPDAVADPRLGTHAPAFGESSSGRTITNPVSSEPAAAPAAPAQPPAAPHKGGH